MTKPSLLLCLPWLVTAAIAQPTGETVTQLGGQIEALTQGDEAERLKSIRRIALHRHLFAGANRSVAIRTFGELVARDALGQAAAAACYLAAGAPQPSTSSDSPAWRISWSAGLAAQLDAPGKRRLRDELVSSDPRRRAWAAFALARHRITDAAITKALREELATGTPDRRALAARTLAPQGLTFADIRRSLADCPDDLVPQYCAAIADLAERDPKAFDATIPLLQRGIGAAMLGPKAVVLGALEKRPTLDLPRIRILLTILEAVDDSGEGSFRDYHASQLRWRAARRLGRAPATFESAILDDLHRQLQRPERNLAVYDLIQALGSRARSLMEPLFARLGHPDRRERERAAIALGEIGDLHHDDLQRLANHLDDEHDGFRRAIAETIAGAADRAVFLAPSMHARLVAGDLQVADAYGRLAAIDDEALDRLVEHGPPTDPAARRSMAQALARSGRRRDPRVIRWLTEALSSRDYPVLLAVQQLGATDPRLIRAVATLLGDAHHDRALYAACCLASLRCAKERAVPVLLRYMRDDGSIPGKREIAIDGLVRYPDLDASIVTEIATRLYTQSTLLGAKRSYFHQRVAHSLGKLGSAGEPAIPGLLAALRDANLHLSARIEVLDTLGRISGRPSEVIPILLDNSRGRTEHVARAAHRAALGYGRVAIPVLERIAEGKDANRADTARRLLLELR